MRDLASILVTWGLRDYNLEPSVWGGKPGHEHEWGGDFVVKDAHSDTGTSTLSGPNAAQMASGTFEAKSQFCRCGAWRGTLGLEPDPELYVAHIVEVMREVRRVMRSDAVMFLNMGDSYAGSGKGQGANGHAAKPGDKQTTNIGSIVGGLPTNYGGLKAKDLILMPARVALALQADGWWVRSRIVWKKDSPMPESLAGWRWERHRVKVKPSKKYRDCPGCGACTPHDRLILRKGSWRPTTAHEYIFELTKSENYYGDGEAVREHAEYGRSTGGVRGEGKYVNNQSFDNSSLVKGNTQGHTYEGGRNLRSVWTFPSESFGMQMCESCGMIYTDKQFRRLPSLEYQVLNTETEEMEDKVGKRCLRCHRPDAWFSHYAAFPSKLPETCILAGTSERGVCAECGAPWARVVERVETGEVQKMADGWDTGSGAHGTIHRNGREEGERGKPVIRAQTTGWRPTCRCPGLDGDGPWPILEMHPEGEANWPTVPATVLDPFVGSGTSCVVAQKLGRQAIGVDLSADYLALATRRLKAVPLPMVMA